MCYQEARWHAFCDHTIESRVPCATPTSCPQAVGTAAVDTIETHVTTHCHQCQATVDNLGVSLARAIAHVKHAELLTTTTAAASSPHRRSHSAEDPRAKKPFSSSYVATPAHQKRWSPRPGVLAGKTTTRTTRTSSRLASSLSMDNLRRGTGKNRNSNGSGHGNNNGGAGGNGSSGQGTPGRILHSAASTGDLRERQRRARAASDSGVVPPLPLPSLSSGAASSGSSSSLTTGRNKAGGGVMRNLRRDEELVREWEEADAKPWSIFDLMVSPEPPPALPKVCLLLTAATYCLAILSEASLADY